jgi:hypothetical protein
MIREASVSLIVDNAIDSVSFKKAGFVAGYKICGRVREGLSLTSKVV